MIVKVKIDYEKSIYEKGSFEIFSEYEKVNEIKDFICKELRQIGYYILGYSKLVAPENAVISTQEDILKVLKKIYVKVMDGLGLITGLFLTPCHL